MHHKIDKTHQLATYRVTSKILKQNKLMLLHLKSTYNNNPYRVKFLKLIKLSKNYKTYRNIYS